MSKCSVKGCFNSSKDKIKMNSFPRNSQLRSLWIKNMGQTDWTPNTNSRLCEAHFAPEMWEKTRVDGTRKLKFKAVPTIFKEIKLEESEPIQIQIDSIEDLQKLNNVITLPIDKSGRKDMVYTKQKLIQILPAVNSATVQPAQFIFPVSLYEQSCVNSKNIVRINNADNVFRSAHTASGAVSILKPKLKAMNNPVAPMVITPHNENQTTITIPANTSVLKSQATKASAILALKNINNDIQETPKIKQEMFIPVSSTVLTSTNSPGSADTNNVTASRTVPMKSVMKTVSQPVPSKGFILNKTQAKKLEDERFKKMDSLLLKQLKLNNALRKKLQYVNQKMHQLMKEQNNDCKAYLRNVFTEDQIRALELRHTNPKSNTAWSHKTMVKALKLKEECGSRGYMELLKQNYPLPSIRTICRWCNQRNIPIP